MYGVYAIMSNLTIVVIQWFISFLCYDALPRL